MAAGVAQECLVRKGTALLSFDQEIATAFAHFRQPQIVTCFCLLYENNYKYFQKPDIVIRSCFSQGNTQNTPEKSQRMLCVVVFVPSSGKATMKPKDYNVFLVSFGKQVDSELQQVGLEPATGGCKPTS